ncbi:hypothetical protein DH2020_034452 [Rehmannia glutinosa]|uniref:Late embryogenesis abundant protein LEA-2 subgroup domain-containing protein n=1 Tax=Rehmannia glutinosa TaxID=99300 RepID=A0ABR0VA02_REHGL
MRVRNPKIRVRSVTVEFPTVNNSTNSPSFSMISLNAKVTVKNKNFGHFKFSDSAVSIIYRGSAVGNAVIPGSRVGARSTKKMNVTVAVGSNMDPFLDSGMLTLSSHAKLEGSVYLFKVIKRKKTATMNCTMDVDTRSREVVNLRCKKLTYIVKMGSENCHYKHDVVQNFQVSTLLELCQQLNESGGSASLLSICHDV